MLFIRSNKVKLLLKTPFTSVIGVLFFAFLICIVGVSYLQSFKIENWKESKRFYFTQVKKDKTSLPYTQNTTSIFSAAVTKKQNNSVLPQPKIITRAQILRKKRPLKVTIKKTVYVQKAHFVKP